MSKIQHDVMLRVVKILNVLMIELPFAGCWFLYYSHQTYANLAWEGHFAILGLFFILYIALGKIYDAFWMSMQRVSELVYGQILGAMATDGILYIVICLMSAKLCNLLPGIAAIAGQLVMAAIWASCAHKWYYKTFPPQKTAVVYDVRHGMEKLINEYGLSQKYDVQVTLSVSECLADLSILDGMETVFVSGVHSHERNIILKHCVGKGINMFVIPRVGDVIMSGAWPMHMFHLPMLRVGRYMASPEFLFVKRAMDIVISLLALIILSPLFLITAIAVKSDGGPAFYKQVRLTKDGKQFEILKFRSMRVDAEKDGVARLSTGDKDDRITKVGHIIRACRLDELPQLLNILKGDLSVVGPRPERPEIAAQYCEEMPEFALRLQAKAGLTGYAQVYGKYNTTPYDKLQMDLMYIAHPSLIEDLKIMLATVKILFMPESTEGVAEPIDPERLASSVLGLNVKMLPLCSDGSILGLTVFQKCGFTVTLGDGTKLVEVFMPKDVVIDSALASDSCTGCRNFTIAHEAAHHILADLFPNDYGKAVKCRGHIAYRERNGQPSWEEWQANTLAAELLMPTFLVNAEIERAALCLPNGILYKSASDPNYERILEMAARIGVSWSAIRIRLQQMQVINGKPIHCHPLDVIRFGE